MYRSTDPKLRQTHIVRQIECCLINGTEIHTFDRAPSVLETAPKEVIEDYKNLEAAYKEGKGNDFVDRMITDEKGNLSPSGRERFHRLEEFAEALYRERVDENRPVAQDILNAVGQDRTFIFYGELHGSDLASLLGTDRTTYIRMEQNSESQIKYERSRKWAVEQGWMVEPKGRQPDLVRYMDTGRWAVTSEGVKKGYDKILERFFPAGRGRDLNSRGAIVAPGVRLG